MKMSKLILLWAPRFLLIGFALFLVIFSLDVFGEGKDAVDIAIGLLMHNLPSLFLGLVVFVAWRREWVGVAACVLLASAWIAWALGRLPLADYFLAYLFIPGPLFLIAVLYGVNWWIRGHSIRTT